MFAMPILKAFEYNPDLTLKNIADRLAISDRTVEKYRTRLIEKSGAVNRIEVIVFALKNGLVEI
jgi:DNA-binding NarL/FixJ family response regulator